MKTSTPPPLPSPVNPPKPDWRRAFGGVWRLTYQRFLAPKQLAVLAGLLLLMAALEWTNLHQSDPLSLKQAFGSWTIQFYLAFVVPVISFLSSGGLIRDDMSPATVDYVLIRPMKRHAFVLSRYFSQLICLQVQYLLALGVVAAVAAFRQVPDLSETVPSLLFAQLLAIPAYGAMGFAFGAFTNRFIVIGLIYGGIIELGIGNIPTQINSIAMLHQVRSIANSVLPLRGKAAQYVESLPTAVTTLLVASAIFLAISALLFSTRETVGSKPKDT